MHQRLGGYTEDTYSPEGTNLNSCGRPVARKSGAATSQPVRLAVKNRLLNSKRVRLLRNQSIKRHPKYVVIDRQDYIAISRERDHTETLDLMCIGG